MKEALLNNLSLFYYNIDQTKVFSEPSKQQRWSVTIKEIQELLFDLLSSLLIYNEKSCRRGSKCTQFINLKNFFNIVGIFNSYLL